MRIWLGDKLATKSVMTQTPVTAAASEPDTVAGIRRGRGPNLPEPSRPQRTISRHDRIGRPVRGPTPETVLDCEINMPHASWLSPREAHRRFKELTAAVRQGRSSLRAAEESLQRLVADNPYNLGPVEVLERSDPSFRKALERFLDKPGASSVDLVSELRQRGRALPAKVFRGSSPSYDALLAATARRLRVPFSKGAACWSIESAIAVHLFNRSWQAMSPEQRHELGERLQEDLSKMAMGAPKLSREMFAASGLVLAQAAGFAPYLAASTLFGALTNAIGITLPFAFYANMAATIAFVIGPAGFVFLAGMVAFKLMGPSYEDLLKGIVTIGCARSCLGADWDRQVTEARRRVRSAQEELGIRKQARRKARSRLAEYYAGYAAILLVILVGIIRVVKLASHTSGPAWALFDASDEDLPVAPPQEKPELNQLGSAEDARNGQADDVPATRAPRAGP